MNGFEATSEDLEMVLRRNFLRLKCIEEVSFSVLADRLLPTIDQCRVERAALRHATDINAQTQAACEELEAQLVESGVLATAESLEQDLPGGSGECEEGQETVVVSLSVRYDLAGTPVSDLISGLERNVEAAIGMGMLTDDGPATVGQYQMSIRSDVSPTDGWRAGAIENWLRDRFGNGELGADDLIQLAARYACADRGTLLKELSERIADSGRLGVDVGVVAALGVSAAA